MQKPSLKHRLRYAFDNLIAKGVFVMILGISLSAVVIIFLISVFVTLSGIDPGVSLVEQFWDYLLLTLEPDAPDNHLWSFRLVTLLVVFIGILLVGSLVGVITTSIQARLDQLRQGRSKVLERNHTIILGWSEQVFTIVTELVVAKAQQSRSPIVILGDRDKVLMENQIRAKVGKTGRTKVICRRGSPVEMTDLAIVSVQTAKSIIILSPPSDDPDSSAIKTLLAIVNDPHRRPEPYHIVMHLQEAKNARVAQIVGRDELEVVVTTDFIARITAQTCRQSGLAAVYLDLLDFNGQDICFQRAPALASMAYGDVLLAYTDAAVIGMQPQGGTPHLNPPPDTRLTVNDELIIVGKANSTLHPTATVPMLDESVFHYGRTVQTAPEHTIVLGWNKSVPQMIRELDRYVVRGSTITVVADVEWAEGALLRRCASLQNQRVTFQFGDTADREVLDTLPLDQYDHAILVAYSDQLDLQHADARTLVTLLHVRDIIQQRGLHLSIVSEMRDIRNRNLVTVTHADDFVISEQLISFYLAQVAESKLLHLVFAELFDAEGMEIYLKPALDYVKAGVTVDFYTIVAAASRRQETAIGYRLQRNANDPAQNYGIVLNPTKTTTVTLGPADRMIVIAQE
jgi:ion channel POLLUX/CASTOR